MKCDTCLDMLREGLHKKLPAEELQHEYLLHLAFAHGIQRSAQVITQTTREELTEFWRTFTLPDKP